MNLLPRSGSKLSTAFISPIKPTWIRSSRLSSDLQYFLDIGKTAWMFSLIISLRTSRLPVLLSFSKRSVVSSIINKTRDCGLLSSPSKNGLNFPLDYRSQNPILAIIHIFCHIPAEIISIVRSTGTEGETRI